MSSMEFPSHASTGAGGTGAGAVLSRPVGDFSCPVLWVVSHHSGIFPFPSCTPPLLDWPPHSVAVPCPRSWRTLGAAIPAPGRGSASSGLPWGRAGSVLLSRAARGGSVPHSSALSPGITFQRLVRTEQGLPVKNYQSSTV